MPPAKAVADMMAVPLLTLITLCVYLCSDRRFFHKLTLVACITTIMILKEVKTELFADYFQIYLQDETAEGDLSDAWTQHAVDILLALAPGTVGIGTARNMFVPIIIKLYEFEPALLQDSYEISHINECDLETNSNKLVISGCTDYFPDALRIDVKKGIYRVRIYYCNLDKLSEDGLEGEDYYEVHLWQSNASKGLAVLKDKNACA